MGGCGVGALEGRWGSEASSWQQELVWSSKEHAGLKTDWEITGTKVRGWSKLFREGI